MCFKQCFREMEWNRDVSEKVSFFQTDFGLQKIWYSGRNTSLRNLVFRPKIWYSAATEYCLNRPLFILGNFRQILLGETADIRPYIAGKKITYVIIYFFSTDPCVYNMIWEDRSICFLIYKLECILTKSETNLLY
jgi:hypothetical protein